MSNAPSFILGYIAPQTVQATHTEVAVSHSEETHSSSSEELAHGLIADLGFILVLGAIATLLFKKLKQPVVLGYIIAGFLASPNFEYLPSISNLSNIEVWAQLGIVVLMFTLGLEFSFKKLLNSGSSAFITALIIITGMTFAGFGVGRLLHMNTINCIFLGGMISMSSTTIILKALTDLGLRQKKFASLVLAVLIIEDLFAVLMLVILSSIAVGDVESSELLMAIAKLGFFLIIWFVVGVYLLPPFFDKYRTYLNSETLLICSMGLCFGMAVLSVACGFSLELGAFVMGSILAGTMAAERIDKVVHPIKDLFGAVFFISVGMMVEPSVIAQYWSQILLLALVVITGMILFGTIGMIVTGQSLKVAMESGFTLTQVGEFSFIIASLGMGLGVLDASLYPIIVAVSVITIFTTPYFIKLSGPAYEWTARHLPQGLNFLITRYSHTVTSTPGKKQYWRALLLHNLWRIILYSAILIAIILCSIEYLYPLCNQYLGGVGKPIATLSTLVVMSPFIMALAFTSSRKNDRKEAGGEGGFYEVPVLAVKILRVIVALLFVVYFISMAYTATIGWIVGVFCFLIIILAASRQLRNHYNRMEQKFMDNLNIRENTRLGTNNNIVDDLHMAYIEISQTCSFAGDKLRDSGLRKDYGVSVSSIQRGQIMMPLPSSDARLLPGDVLGVIGTDDQIKHLNDDLAREQTAYEQLAVKQPEVKLATIRLTSHSPIIGIPLAKTDIRKDYYSLIVKIMRGEDQYIQPEPDTVLQAGDTLWVVGDPEQFDKMI